MISSRKAWRRERRIDRAAGRALRRRGLVAFLTLVSFLVGDSAGAQESCGLDERVAFTGHSFPLDGALVQEDLSVENAFPNWSGIGVGQPTYMTYPPDGTNRIFIAERPGIVKAIANRPDVAASELRTVIDISSIVDSTFTEEGLLGMAFHPEFSSNGYFYLNFTAIGSECAENSRCMHIDRFQMDPGDPNSASPDSGFTILEIERPGSVEHHNGGMIEFGSDGYLYISVGDQGDRSLARDTSSLRGKILRIDVDSGSEFNPGIPEGNPFENPVWFFGLRNPWRFSFDRENPGDLWIADVGSRFREEVNWVPAGTPGGLDFGWPDCEGTVPLTPTGCDSTQWRPDLEYPTGVAGRSAIIGGYVYRGPLASLNGHYLFADFSGQIMTWDRTTRDPETGLGVIEERLVPFAFIGSLGEDEAGEVYAWDYFRQQVPSRLVGSSPTPGDPYPENLSETGLFANVATLTPAPGLIEYEVNAALWSDGAAKKRWIALPGDEQITFRSNSPWSFPVGTALVKHFELEQAGASPRRLETRVMLRQSDQWVGFTYRWNAEATDATLLLDAFREDVDLAGGEAQSWLYPSPSECLGCHSGPSGRALGVRSEQLNRVFDYGEISDNQLHAWNCIELFDTDIGDAAGFASWASLDDLSVSTARRARSYLASNCAICHQPGTGVANMDLRFGVLISDMHIVSDPPIRGDFGLPSPAIVDPGNHANSILSLRMESTQESERMAKGTLMPHGLAMSVLSEWIDTVLYDSGSGTTRLDSDEDGLNDEIDNCPGVSNPNQANADGDELGDPCDPDQQPDLRLTSNLPGTAARGQTISVGATVLNAGLLTAEASQVRFHLSLDPVLDGLDASVGDCFTPAIEGASSGICADPTGRVPDQSEIVEGEYFWLACADALDRVAEGDETNNCEATPVLIPEPGSFALQIMALLTVLVVAAWREETPVECSTRSL